jgi:chemotaxis protein methyltransferase CheR
MTVTEPQLRSFASVIATRLGLRIDDRHAAKVIDDRAAVRGLATAAYLRGFDEPDELRALATELTTGETYFFRQPEQLDALVEVAVPARLAAPARARELAILSAGCSTGEEPYTIAMLLHDRMPPGWSLVIHGVDIDARAIAHARRARYTRWSLRAVSPALEHRWFVREGEAAALVPEIRDAVTFAEHNLVTDDELWSRSWDIVLCRNVLMYLTDDHIEAVGARLGAGLAPGGFLFVGFAEAMRARPASLGVPACAIELETRSSHGAFYYVRRDPDAASSVASATPGPDDEPGADERSVSDRLAHAAASLRDQIAELIRDERFSDARTLLAAVPVVTGDRELLLLSAVVHLSLGELDDVEHDCFRVLALDAASAPAHYLIAQCREAGGDPSSAIDHARMARSIDPGFALAHLQLGRLARRTGDGETARAALATALGLLEHEDPVRLARYGGGFGCGALIGMCHVELAALGEPG